MTLEVRYVAMARKHESAAIELDRDAARLKGDPMEIHVLKAAKALRELALMYVAYAEEVRREGKA